MSEVFSSNSLNMTYALLTELKSNLQKNQELFSINSAINLIDNIADFLFIGDQSTGKTSIITRLVREVTDHPFELYTGSGTATKMPTVIRFRRDPQESIVYEFRNNHTNEGGIVNNINEEMKTYTISEMKGWEAIVTVSGPNASEFSITDMPGLMASAANSEEELNKTYIENLIKNRVNSKNCIVMHIINAANDIHNSVSYNFITNILGVPAERQIIVATQVDLIAQKTRDGAHQKMVHFRHFFPLSKILFVIPQNGNGFLTNESELAGLRFMSAFIDNNVELGIKALAKEIPRRLNEFAKTLSTDVLPYVQELGFHCQSRLKNIGFMPRDPITALNEWSHCVHEITQIRLRDNREQVNNLLLEETNEIAVEFKANDARTVQTVEQIIQKCRRTCGETRPDLISRDPAFRETVQNLGNELLERVNAFNNNKLRPLFENVIQNMFEEILSKNPACELVSKKMLDNWFDFFEEIWVEYQEGIIHEITRGIKYPQPRHRINQDLLTAELVIQEYERIARSNTNVPDTNSLQLFKRWIQAHKSDENVDVSVKAILQYVDAFWKDFSATIVSDLRSSIEEISRSLHMRFNGPFITALTRETDTVAENNVVSNIRETSKTIMNLCQTIIENYNEIN